MESQDLETVQFVLQDIMEVIVIIIAIARKETVII